MSKSPIEKAIEKQMREAQKAARQEQLRDRARSIIAGAENVNGFRVMDKESEDTLQAILEQYNGNENNYVFFEIDGLPYHLRDSFGLQCEKLLMYGVLSSANITMITLSETGKNYFSDKEDAYLRNKEREEKELQIISYPRKQYDVFISHANKDKGDYVDLLNVMVRRLGINVFYDTEVLSWGDNWKQVILEGTANSEFAIIVISKNFFGREWTEKELNEFLLQQNESGQKIVLPLLHEITLDELKEHYPQLGDIQCIDSGKYTKEEITIFLAKELIKRYKNQ